MKTNNTVINSIMNSEVNRTFMVKKSFLKYICAILLLVGTSAHAWGAPYLEYNSTKYYDGQTVTINLAQTTLPAHGSPSMAVKNDAGWTQDTYSRYGIITTTLSGASVPSNVSFLMGSYAASAGTPVGDYDETSYYTYNTSAQYWNASFQLGYYFAAAGTYDVTMTITETDQADGTTVLQSATITVRFVVSFTGYTITYNLTGLEHANPYNPTATSGEFHAQFELADNYGTPITGTYSDGFVTNAPITIGTSGDCYYNLGDLYYNATPEGNVTINLTATTTCTPLAAPGSLTLSQNHDATHGKTRFGWNSVANASGYKVTVSNGSTTASVETASDRYYYITTFPAGNYTWSVSAIGDGSTYCEENDATDGTPFCVGADLSAVTPSNLAASEVTNTTATISWDEVANAAGYELLIVDDDETTIDDYSGSGTSWDITGLTAGTTYTIWWQAVNSCDDSYNSNIDKSVSFTTTNNHTVSFNANGGSGSIDDVIRAHGTTYDLPGCTFVAPSGKVFKCWAEGSAGGTERAVGYTHTVNADITFYAKWRDAVITDYVFSCSELALTPHLVTASTPIFITSAANKKVRSQDYITITGSGLTPNTPLTFPGLDSKFEVLTATGGAISTDASGAIDDVNAYIFYTPAADATTDGLDKMAGLTVSVGGAKPKQVTLIQEIIGRHLPTAGYVIAGKKDNKWYALPANMASTTNPKPAEIAVNDINNPSIAYTATSNIYSYEGPTAKNISDGNGQYIRFVMLPLWVDDADHSKGHAPLFGSATGTRTIGKSGNSQATSNLSEGWWWALTQTNTSISNPQDAKYTIKCANNTSTLSLRENAGNPDWGLFASGVEELRLIPASDVPYTEAYFVEWGQHGGVIEVDAESIDATSVTAHLGANSSTTTLSQTQTSVKNRASIYNYTVNFGNDINFAAAASNGALLTLEWKNGETVKAITSILVPKIIAASSTLSSHGASDGDWSSAEVHVLPGVTLTANAGDFSSNDVMIKHLEIYPGATVVVTKGDAVNGTLKVKTLVLRNGWTRAGEKAYDVARLYITPTTASLAKNAGDDVWYADWYIDYDQYYPVAVPWDVTLANITYRYCSVEPTVGHDKNIRLRYYDGEQRASSGQSQIGQNWKLYGDAGAESVPTKLDPSKGYALTAKRPTGKAFSIIRMPLTIPSADWISGGEKGEVGGTHKDQVSVTGWGKGSAEWYAMGWNFIGNPYMCTFNGDDDGISGKIEYQDGGSIRYATIPDVDFTNYYQVNITEANLLPASGFFIQANNTEAQNITFSSSKIVPPSAPARYLTQTEVVPEQEAYIRLSYEGGKDQMGLIIGEDYTAEYELNADLAKILGDANAVKTFMHYSEMDLAYVAINAQLAKELIPVTVMLPVAGEYTFSLTNSSMVENMEGIYLIDYANNGKITNLIEEDYIFTGEAGTYTDRFVINGVVGHRNTPEGVDAVDANTDTTKPVKFLYRDKIYILNQGVIYDATGQKVREIIVPQGKEINK